MTISLTPTERLQAPVRRYFDELAALSRPRTGLARLLQPVLERVGKIAARNRLRDALRDVVARLHSEAAQDAAAQAGTFVDLPALRKRIAAEHETLEGFLRDVGGLTEPLALRRIALYARAAQHTGSMAAAGQLPTLPIYPGDRRLACKGFCKCHLEVRRVGAQDFDVYWVLGQAEHCEDCVRLSLEWNPLKIRQGVITSVKALTADEVDKLKAAVAALYGLEVNYGTQ